MNDLFAEAILDEAKAPSNFGQIESPDKTAAQYNASCGDVINVFLDLSPDKKILEKIAWTGQGCTISMAAMSVVSQHVEGMTVAEILQLEQADILKLLNLEEISPGRIRCLNIGLKAVQKALQ